MSTYIQKLMFFLITCMVICLPKVHGQQDSQYSQYMYNTVIINPGYAGSREMMSAFGLYRNQWVGLEGAPETLIFSINSPIGAQGVGLGVNFISDRIGPSSENNITADFSYTINVFNSETKLSFGLKAGINNFSLDVNKLNMENPSDVSFISQNVLSPQIGLGAYLFGKKWYFGLSAPNVLKTEHFDEVTVSTITEKMHVYAIGGYVFNINPDLKLKPAFLIKAVSGAPLSMDISSNLKFYEKFTLGASYRFKIAVGALAGFNITDQIMVGYAYDYETSPLTKYTSGSHEIFLRFEFVTRLYDGVNPRFF